MPKHITLTFGSQPWIIGLTVSIIIAFIVLYWPRLLNMAEREKMRKGLAVFYFVAFISFQFYAIYDKSWNVASTLPLQLCAISYIFSILALINKNQFCFEFAFYFGIAGGLNSLLTPEFAHGYDAFYFVHYYFEHSGIVVIPIFLSVAFNMKPRKLSWLRILIPASILAFAMYFVNLWAGGNYMYVNQKPIADNPFVIGDWPYYIFMLELVALVHFYIIYIVFYKFKRWI